jgi:hypothetical protein
MRDFAARFGRMTSTSGIAATDELLTVVQAAAELNIAPRTLNTRIQLGEIAATKHGTGATSPYIITRSDLERHRREIAQSQVQQPA